MMAVLSWPDWVFWQVDAEPVGLLLLLVVSVLCTWGVALVRGAYLYWSRPDAPRWHPHRWLPISFELWLGVFMLADSSLYGLLAYLILTDDGGVDLWVVLYFAVVAVPAVAAFAHWARQRFPGGGES